MVPITGILYFFWVAELQVFKVKWWMRHYHSPTAKRHMALVNTSAALNLDKGCLKRDSTKNAPKTTKKYRDADGKVRYCGTRFLQSTQCMTQLSLLYCDKQACGIPAIAITLPPKDIPGAVRDQNGGAASSSTEVC